MRPYPRTPQILETVIPSLLKEISLGQELVTQTSLKVGYETTFRIRLNVLFNRNGTKIFVLLTKKGMLKLFKDFFAFMFAAISSAIFS